MTVTRKPRRDVQAWIEPIADDPEASSALEVARRRLPGGAHLTGLRRVRLVELRGVLPESDAIAGLLHRSTRFYNPHKERCTLRAGAAEPAPMRGGERAVLVVERGAVRREAAERWWRHETGRSVEVREGVAWLLSFDPAASESDAESLAVVRDRGHGLLCNPHSQDARWAGASVPFPWIAAAPREPRPKAG